MYVTMSDHSACTLFAMISHRKDRQTDRQAMYSTSGLK